MRTKTKTKQKTRAGEPALRGFDGLCPYLKVKPQAEFNLPRVVELAVQHAKIGWVLEIQPARPVLAWIAALHMVERVQELSVEGEPRALGYSGFLGDGKVHVPAVLPELGLTQPGQTIVCGDSHTSTHGAFGTLAFGIGTSEVEHVLAT